MKTLIIYFDEDYILDNLSNESIEVLFKSSSDNLTSKKILDINLLIDEYSIEIREIVWNLYNKNILKLLRKTFYSKNKWINKNIDLAIKSSRFNFGLSFDSDIANLVKVISIIYWAKKQDLKKIYLIGFNTTWEKPFFSLQSLLDSEADIFFQRTKKIEFFNKNNLNIFKSFGSIINYSFKFLPKLFYGPNDKINQRVDYLFIDYFFMNSAKINSQYWDNLPEVLSKSYKVELWHFFVPSSENSSMLDASKIIKKLNKNSKKNIHHRLIDLELGFKDLFPATLKVLIIFIYFITKKFKTKLYPLITKDYQKSFFSGEIVKSFLLYSFFNRSLPKDLKKTTIIYVGENQPWEKSLADIALQRGCQNSIFSFQTSLRFWDMRFYNPYISFKKSLNKSSSISFPSIFACNSKFSLNQMSKQLPSKILKVVENFRFNFDFTQIDYDVKKNIDPRILFIGEYSEKKTREIFKLIENSIIVKERYKIFFRPHPSDNSNFFDENKKKFSSLDEDTNKKNNNYNIIIGDSISTFLLKAFLRGQRVLAFHSKCTLNLSPLYKAPFHPPFFSSVNELNNLISNINENHQFIKKEYVNEFVEPNTNYNKWLQILNKI